MAVNSQNVWDYWDILPKWHMATPIIIVNISLTVNGNFGIMRMQIWIFEGNDCLLGEDSKTDGG